MKILQLKQTIGGMAGLIWMLFAAWSSPGRYSAADEASNLFIREALSCNRMEIQLALMASRRAESAEVKALAKNVLDFQNDLNRKLKRFAAEEQLEASDAMSAKSKDALDKLNRLSGILFERKYVSLAGDNHKVALILYRQAMNQSANAHLNSFVRPVLPFLESQHTAISLVSKAVKERSKR